MTEKPAVIFCHGLESGPHGKKYNALVKSGIPVISPDFRGMDLTARVDHLLREVEKVPESTPLIIVGSSFGALVAALAAPRLATNRTIAELLLLAPAIVHPQAPNPLPKPPAPTTIIYGRYDELIPLEKVRSLAEEWETPLIEVPDRHDLNGSHTRIIWEVKRVLDLTKKGDSK